VKITDFRWLVLLSIPGCLLVQPLDDAKPADESSAGSGNSSGKPSHAGNGSAGHNTAGSGPAGGTGNAAGSGPSPGGAPSSTGGGSPPIDQCVPPGRVCEFSSDCCQTGADLGSNGAACLADDYLCHALCLSNSECVSDCCVELDGEEYGACVDPSYCAG